MIVIYSETTGQIQSVVHMPASTIDDHRMPGWGALATDGAVKGLGQRVDLATLQVVDLPPKPTPYHDWDYGTQQWACSRLSDALADKKYALSASRTKASLQPCDGFDADVSARSNISGVLARLIRGDGLPDGWIGWRDASNTLRWANLSALDVQLKLSEVACAIEDREQALIVMFWTKKAQLETLTTLDEVMAFDTSML